MLKIEIVWEMCLFNVCYSHVGIDEISEDVYKGVDHSDSEDSEKSDSSDSEYLSDEDPKPKSSVQDDKDKAEKKRLRTCSDGEAKEECATKKEKSTPEPPVKDKQGSNGTEKDLQDKPRTPQSQQSTDKTKTQEEKQGPPAAASPAPVAAGGGGGCVATSAAEQDSDSERELVIDLGDEHGGRDAKRARREAAASAAKAPKEPNVSKSEGEAELILWKCLMCSLSWFHSEPEKLPSSEITHPENHQAFNSRQ